MERLCGFRKMVYDCIGIDRKTSMSALITVGRVGFKMLGRNMGLLQKLDLSSNSLSGTIPESLGNLSLLKFLALSSNKLSEEFLKGLPNLQNLEYLIMEDNLMFVPWPFQFGRLMKPQVLRLANLGYPGLIRGSLGWLTNLTTLSLENNMLCGEIPQSLSELARIYHLNLSRNLLSGVISFDASFIKRLGRNLDLSGNPSLCVDGFVEGMEVAVDVCEVTLHFISL